MKYVLSGATVLVASLLVSACGIDLSSGPSAPSYVAPPNPARAMVQDLVMPDARAVGAIDPRTISSGTYKLKMIRTNRTATSSENANYQTAHILNTPGDFDQNDPSASTVDWKGRSGRTAEQKFNVKLKLFATGTDLAEGTGYHYTNKVDTADVGQLYWSSRPSVSGISYFDVFKSPPTVDGDYFARTTDGEDLVGIAYIANNTLVLVVEYRERLSGGHEMDHIVEMTYVK